jgi:hypothetical protein
MEKTSMKKQKNAFIGALVITLGMSLAMGAVGLNAITNTNGATASSGTTVQVSQATSASSQSSISIPSTTTRSFSERRDRSGG